MLKKMEYANQRLSITAYVNTYRVTTLWNSIAPLILDYYENIFDSLFNIYILPTALQHFPNRIKMKTTNINQWDGDVITRTETFFNNLPSLRTSRPAQLHSHELRYLVGIFKNPAL